MNFPTDIVYKDNPTYDEIVNYIPADGNGIVYRYTSPHGDYIGITIKSMKKRAGKDGKGYCQWSSTCTRTMYGQTMTVHRLEKYKPAWQKAIEKYGIQTFGIQILEECSVEVLRDRETYWACHFDSVEHGFNSSMGLKGINEYRPPHTPLYIKPATIETITVIRRSDGREYSSLREAAKDIGKSKQKVRKAIKEQRELMGFRFYSATIRKGGEE